MDGIITKIFLLLLVMTGTCRSAGCAENPACLQPKRPDANSVEQILKKLNRKTKELKSYQCRIEYLFSQPILDSNSLRKGVLYYEVGGGKSNLRINFQSLRQDDEKEQKYVEDYILDGIWLTCIDYQIESVKRFQLAEPNDPNRPTEAFELVSRNFPIIGFSKVENLQKQFEIKLVEAERSEQSGFVRLGLKVRPGSIYKDDYKSIDFWIDKKLYLPAKIVTVSTEEDIYQIKFLKAKVNKKIDKKVFDIKIPKDFGEQIIPLKKKVKK